MCIADKYQTLLAHSTELVRLYKLKAGRGYLTFDEKKELNKAEAAIDRMNREHKSKLVEQIELKL